jgi:hypothetical protein
MSSRRSLDASFDLFAPASDSAPRAGKRALSDGLQCKAGGGAAASAAQPFGPVDRPPESEPGPPVSYLDSILTGIAGPSSELPHMDRIQASFGRHDVTGVQAHTDDNAAAAARGLGASAFATGNHVAFAGAPDLHTAAHEAAHVVQQRAGVHLKGGIGEEGDVYEQHADAVADAVVRGESAEALLDEMAGNGSGGGAAVQMDKRKGAPPPRLKPDGTVLNEVVQKLYAAADALDVLLEMATTLETKGAGDEETMLAYAATMMPAKDAAVSAIEKAWVPLWHHITSQPDQQAARDAAAESPGMEVVMSITSKVGMFYAQIEDADRGRYPKVLATFKSAGVGRLSVYLDRIRANLGMVRLPWDQLRQQARAVIVSGAGAVDLGSGSPRDKIQEACITSTRAWDQSLQRMTAAVGKLISTIKYGTFDDADAGFVGKLLEKAKELISTAATTVSGTPLAAKIGFEAIERLVAYGKELDKIREKEDEETFLNALQTKVKGLEQEQNVRTADFGKTISAIDAEFLKQKVEDPEDRWKSGRRMVYGPQAAMLRDLTTRAEEYAMVVPTTEQYTAAFLTEWVIANHKEKSNSGWRMPTTPSKEMDGYAAIKVKLVRRGDKWSLESVRGGEAKLHCPKSGAVAAELMRAMQPFDLSKLACNIKVTVSYDAGPGRSDPNDDTIELDRIHMPIGQNADRVWGGVTHSADTTTDGVLRMFTKLDG